MKDIAQLLIVLHCYSSALLISLWLILCISTRFNGSSACLCYLCRVVLLLMYWNSVWITWITILPFHYMKMFAEACFKNINCYFLLCWQLKSGREIIRLIIKNGDICCLDLLVKSPFLLIQLIGFLKINGLIFIDSFMELDSLIVSKISIKIS